MFIVIILFFFFFLFFLILSFFFFFFSSRRRHTRSDRDWSSDVCSSDLGHAHWRRSVEPWRREQNASSWPCITQSVHGRSASGTCSRAIGSAVAGRTVSHPTTTAAARRLIPSPQPTK